MRGSLHLFTFRGIDVKVHWTFLLIIGWQVFSGYQDGLAVSQIVALVVYVLLLFVCVVLHEFGHALTAARFGIGTRSITLLPIGGVASLEHMPDDPKQELWITVMGPAVNLVIALLAGTIYWSAMGVLQIPDIELAPLHWIPITGFLFVANIFMLLFNLIPAFPMDGGRILRATLAMRMERPRATRIAATVAQVAAVGFVIGAYFTSNPFLAIIGVFVFLGAGTEARMTGYGSALKDVTVRQVMRVVFPNVPGWATVKVASQEVFALDTPYMVVRDGDFLRGVVTRKQLVAAVHQGQADLPMSSFPYMPLPEVLLDTDAEQAYKLMSMTGAPALPVMEGGFLAGMFDKRGITEFLQARRAGNVI